MKKYLIPAAMMATLAVPGLAQVEADPLGDELDCAIFIAIAMDSVDSEADPDAAVGLAAGLTYFIGRYEGQGGSNLEEDLFERFQGMTLEQLSGLETKCAPQLENMGQGLEAAGRAFIALGDEEAAESGEGSEAPAE
ncbi:hypothetical protein [Altererythrobacter lutimaris]|uniref:Uncharacterized protein n=1 Tax=Altererythrobacter lutimaris TaxID=2743979 RepID=A0A850H7U1_9SPHN|nr:hypothetical protein [Altererythrobacter lutimaris]NVE93839.1 hypothetical protein [Altererythrobacter lutimaris]